MPRYVILEHDHPVLHWDLMLESADVLRTWRLAAPPQPGQCVAAEAAFDHRRHYLDYEGPVGGNRGQVRRWDAGTFTWETNERAAVVAVLTGQRLSGVLRLSLTRQDQWSAYFEPEVAPPQGS